MVPALEGRGDSSRCSQPRHILHAKIGAPQIDDQIELRGGYDLSPQGRFGGDGGIDLRLRRVEGDKTAGQRRIGEGAPGQATTLV
jgi:hypothetical protein